jgi:Fic family protein
MSATESEQIENKQSLNEWREVVESVAAFATAHGGLVRVGVGPSGERIGVQLGLRSLENEVSDRQALRDLRALAEEGFLARKGSGAATHYVLPGTLREAD